MIYLILALQRKLNKFENKLKEYKKFIKYIFRNNYKLKSLENRISKLESIIKGELDDNY